MIKIGQKLYEERIHQGLSLEEVSKATKIRVSFLTAIENGDYTKLPSSAYIQGFVKNYIEFLGLPQKEYLALFRREFNEKEYIKVLPEGFSKKGEITLNRFRWGQGGLAFLLVFLALVAYIGYQYRYAFLNPPLSVASPKEGETYPVTVTVSGSTDANATVFVNEVPVALDKSGQFHKDISVFPGNEVVIIKSKNRFGKETVIERHITVNE